ncbi:hypothetical protein ABIE67_006379 [Streptomyces sp. V4I8]
MNGKVRGHIRERFLSPIFWRLAVPGAEGVERGSVVRAGVENEYVNG